jgi:hypothetical protein
LLGLGPLTQKYIFSPPVESCYTNPEIEIPSTCPCEYFEKGEK